MNSAYRLACFGVSHWQTRSTDGLGRSWRSAVRAITSKNDCNAITGQQTYISLIISSNRAYINRRHAKCLPTFNLWLWLAPPRTLRPQQDVCLGNNNYRVPCVSGRVGATLELASPPSASPPKGPCWHAFRISGCPARTNILQFGGTKHPRPTYFETNVLINVDLMGAVEASPNRPVATET